MPDYIINPSYLIHHGILGQKWGVRRSPEQLGYRVRYKTGKLSSENYATAQDAWNNLSEFPGLTQREKERVYEEFDNNLTKHEKSSPIVSKRIDNYLYKAVNRGHNDYKIYDKELCEYNPSNWDEFQDYIYSEVVGKDWRLYE